ncbi:MAG: formylmethanofuran dehydrogenase [Deltaproteobacteria bacterium]|nr:MAG: formylmethanofuran dehydrogenase [Deltaproteobacteria bacterium]
MKEILEKTFQFHGHICWASAIGARAGMAALAKLEVARTGTSSELHCLIEIGEHHGAQCFADGVSFATGCTIGKGNIEKTGYGKLALTLIDKKKQRAVRVSYWPGHHQEIADSAFMKKRSAGVPPTEIEPETAWEMVNILIDAPEKEVLLTGEVEDYFYEDFGEVMGLLPCSNCGELVSRKYIRLVGDNKMCLPCSGYGE